MAERVIVGQLYDDLRDAKHGTAWLPVQVSPSEVPPGERIAIWIAAAESRARLHTLLWARARILHYGGDSARVDQWLATRWRLQPPWPTEPRDIQRYVAHHVWARGWHLSVRPGSDDAI